MADRITIEVARYRPEQEAEPTFQEYEVPCRKDWVILDGLNHIKDHIDGTLSFPAISQVIERTMDAFEGGRVMSLADVRAVDLWARARAADIASGLQLKV